MLAVSLVVEIDGESVTLNDREYKIQWVQNQGKVIAWPNFVSEKWNKYYLFSEYTDGDTEQFSQFSKLEVRLLRPLMVISLLQGINPLRKKKDALTLNS